MRTRPTCRAWPLLALALAAWLVALLSACGGGEPEPAAPPAAVEVAAGQTAQATLGAAGGTVLLATREGARFTLEVPAGAVPEGTLLALETAPPAAGRRLHLRVRPAGLVPASPLRLTLALPPALTLPAGAALVYDRAPLPFARRADGSLELQLVALAAGTAGAAAAPVEGRARALSARALSAPPAPACAGVPELEATPEGGLTDTSVVEADVYGQCMLGAVGGLASSGQFAEAVRLASAVGAYLQSIGAVNTDGLSTRFLTEARSLACTAYGQALDAAADTTVTGFAVLTRAVKPVLFWEAAVQQLGATCAGIPPTRYVDVVENLTTRALAFYAGKKGSVVDVGSVEYTEAVAELRAAPQAQAQLRSLQAPAPVQALARAQVQERAQPAIVDAVLQAPWQRCRDDGAYDRLIELMQAADSPAGVKTAAQYCGTRLQAQGKDRSGAVTATLMPALGGVAAGQQRSDGRIDVATDGTLVLAGPIRALQCPAGSGGGSESLQVLLGSTLLQTLTAAPYLASGLEIDIAQALQAAGIDAASFTGATLTLRRSGNPCDGFWGEPPEPLLTLELGGGRCLPAEGEPHCVSPIDTATRWPVLAHTEAGVLLGQDCEPGTAPCGAVWRAGVLRSLPAGFIPRGMADDGTVVGHELGAVDPFNARALLHVAGLAPGATTPTRIATTDPYDPAFAGGTRSHRHGAPVVSPGGRISYAEFEEAIVPPTTDLGFCQRVTYPSGRVDNFCARTLWHSRPALEASDAIVHRTVVPDPVSQLLVGDLEGIGRYGSARNPTADTELASIDFASVATGGAGRTQLLAVDEDGRRLVRQLVGGVSSLIVEPAVTPLPDGWVPAALGRRGHLLLLSPDRTRARVLDLRSQVLGPEIAPSLTIAATRERVDLAWAGLGANATVDAQGRIAVAAYSPTRPGLTAVVLTPRGLPLP